MSAATICWIVIAFFGGVATLALALVIGCLIMLLRWMRETASWDRR